MSSPDSSSTPTRRDPLSIFLGVATLVLGLMYALDAYHDRALRAHTEAVTRLAQGELAPPACEVHPVGGHGDEALIQCEGLDAQQTRARARKAFSKTPPPARFARFSFRDARQTLRCDAADLEDCEASPLPDRAALEAARRRRPRER